MAEVEFKADELDSIINVIGLKPSDPVKSFGGIWYQVFLWALFSSMFVHIIATVIAFCRLRKHKMGRWIPVAIFVVGVVSPVTLGVVSSAAIAFFYRASDVEMAPFYALLWGLGQTIIGIIFSFTRILATL
ncbi:T170A-like protein [Mya arenaria]|uniref:T170A-like protein n=1 Tax=Mya arenaria TaxID=6604 RepID=A0ABY7ET95_MYAAR|nr:transmembrane protein 170A-like [Mya arenaria]WAR13183.1 T170A-like protein [Mya arenaria]